MNKIKVFWKNEPVLDIKMGVSGGESMPFGLHRDRNPDTDWGELRHGNMTGAKEVKATPELRQILLEDLAYTYGNDTKKFKEKLIEFGFKIN